MSKRFLLFCIFMVFLKDGIGQTVQQYDIIIDEILADPSPTAGLPDAEFIEIRNNSENTLNLHNWKISNGNNIAIIKTDVDLKPDSLLVLCATANAADFSFYGTTIGVAGFPSLNNDAGTIILYSPDAKIIHALSYNRSWFRDDVKSEGGWSLEMIDTSNPCSGYSNWTASLNNNGGSPGQKNSVNANNPDEQAPALLRTYTTDSMDVVAVFDEPVDSSVAAVISSYDFDKGLAQPLFAQPLPPFFNEVRLRLSTPLLANNVYHLTVNTITDCSGNSIAKKNSAKVGLAEAVDSLSVAINEVLFNPAPGGFDYIEFYNRSKQVLDLKDIYVAGRNSTNGLTAIAPVYNFSWLFFPGEYVVITENKLWVQQHYIVQDPGSLFELPSLPSLPDDAGSIVLLNRSGNIIDELHYSHTWHFPLVNNEEGISLERLDYNKATQRADNWTSTASTAAFGTPGYQNSEFRDAPKITGDITVTPKLFSPDNDGYEDFCMINYKFGFPNNVINITVFDASGRAVRHLVKNATLSLEGSFRWDGLDDKQQALPVGVYVIFTEIFNLKGEVKRFKNAVVVARKFLS